MDSVCARIKDLFEPGTHSGMQCVSFRAQEKALELACCPSNHV